MITYPSESPLILLKTVLHDKKFIKTVGRTAAVTFAASLVFFDFVYPCRSQSITVKKNAFRNSVIRAASNAGIVGTSLIAWKVLSLSRIL